MVDLIRLFLKTLRFEQPVKYQTQQQQQQQQLKQKQYTTKGLEGGLYGNIVYVWRSCS